MCWLERIWPSVVPLFCGGFYAKMLLMLVFFAAAAADVVVMFMFQLVVFGFLHCSTNVYIATILYIAVCDLPVVW